MYTCLARILLLVFVLVSQLHAGYFKTDRKWLELGVGMSGFSFDSTASPHRNSIGVISDNTIVGNMFLQINITNDFALEGSVFGNLTQEMRSYRGMLSEETVNHGDIMQQTITSTGKFYFSDHFLDYDSLLPYVGFGIAYTNLSGNYEANGVRFQTVGSGVTPVFQGGFEAMLNPWMHAHLDFKFSPISTLTPIGGGENITTRNNLIVSARLSVPLFEANR